MSKVVNTTKHIEYKCLQKDRHVVKLKLIGLSRTVRGNGFEYPHNAVLKSLHATTKPVNCVLKSSFDRESSSRTVIAPEETVTLCGKSFVLGQNLI